MIIIVYKFTLVDFYRNATYTQPVQPIQSLSSRECLHRLTEAPAMVSRHEFKTAQNNVSGPVISSASFEQTPLHTTNPFLCDLMNHSQQRIDLSQFQQQTGFARHMTPHQHHENFPHQQQQQLSNDCSAVKMESQQHSTSSNCCMTAADAFETTDDHLCVQFHESDQTAPSSIGR